MQKYIYIILAITILSSCESELKFDPKSQLIPDNVWKDESGAVAVHSGLYGSLRDQVNTIWKLGEIRSDVWGGKSFETEFDKDLIRSNISISNAPFDEWGGFYGRIFQINDFIKNAPEVDFTDEGDLEHFMGEAYGLRAFYYYQLLRTWGRVPLTTDPYEGDKIEGLSKERAPKQEVMARIQDDLQKSLDAFGDDASFWNGNRNYWSKAATLALKGDVYLWAGNILEGGNDDFETAKNALKQVSDMDVGLVSDYDDLWGSDNEDNQEFIFAIQYEEDEAENFFNSYTGRSTEIYTSYNQEGVKMDVVDNGDGLVIDGANRYAPSDKTLNVLDDTLDSRRNATFIRLYKNDNDGAGYPKFNEDNYFGSILDKFLGQVDGSERIFDSDLPIYRYADVVLMLAEAKNQLGEDPSDEINKIRKRAYGNDFDNDVKFTDQGHDENENAILDERYKEFIAEGKRWWDLRRAGDQYVFDNVQYLDPGDEYKFLLPITNDMIGSNPDLEQTEGYND